MNFTKFPANATNIFPIANSKTGGQLLTEFNLRSRESVLTPENVKYFIGPSYCHSESDFFVRVQQDELGVAVSSTALEITDGRAIVNGHYIESLVNVTVDLAEANRELKSHGKSELKGRLAVGLRAMYSTEQTLSSSMRIENNLHMVTGIQIVILPVGEIKSGYFVLPQDSPDNESLVTAHLKLAEFYYLNGQIRSISQNPKKVQALPASRIGSFEGLLADHYVTVDGLDPKKIYTMAGKSEDGTHLSGKPTWCDSTDSLFIWQEAPKRKIINNLNPDDYQINSSNYVADQSVPQNQDLIDPTVLKQADFFIDPRNEQISLALPHKAVDGKMWTTDGKQEIYDPRILTLPQADFSLGTPGTVTKAYTQSIKDINDRINEFYHLSKGRQRAYIEVLNARTPADFNTIEYDSSEEGVLPRINKNWKPGDYVLVNQDNTVIDSTGNMIQSPSTIYVVLPPLVKQITLQDVNPKLDIEELPPGHDGVEIMRRVRLYPGSEYDDEATVKQNIAESFNFYDQSAYNLDFGIETNYSGQVTSTLRGMYKQMSPTSVYALGEVDSTGAQTPPILLEGYESTDEYYDYQDYIVLEIRDVPVLNSNGTIKKKVTHYYYFAVTNVEAGSEAYSNPVLLTGTIPLASTDTIGGFYNVPESSLDNGYVVRDGDGHLRVLDYSLLRSGVLAYQLGQDYEFGSGLSIDEIQRSLDEYVNNRVAFPTESQKELSVSEGRNPNVIKLTLNVSEESSSGSLTLRNIDSRWGTSLHLFISGSATSSLTINIENCEKIRISFALSMNDLDLNSGLGPVLNIYNSNLYYDASMIDYIHRCSRLYASQATASDDANYVYPDGFNGIENLSIWYEKFESDDPNLVINDMTITEINTPVIPEDIDFWSESVINDNHYYYGLQSITLDKQGNVISCGIYMRNDMTANIEFGKTISVAQFILPQGSSLSYPETSITKPIKITGDFVTSYASSSPQGYIVMTTQFTALTQSCLSTNIDSIQKGTISFLSESEFIDDFISVDDLDQGVPIDGWDSNSYHVFKGWTVG